jgi:hypothetical protein
MPTFEEAKEIATKYGPATTAFGLGEEDTSAFENLFADRCQVVLPGDHQQSGIGGPKMMFMRSPGEVPEGYVGLTFEAMQGKLVEQLASVDYAKTEGVSKGVQGDELILEVSRTNKSSEVYYVGYVVATINSDNLISNMKVFW